MTDSMEHFETTGFVLGWIGVICSVISCILLSTKAKQQHSQQNKTNLISKKDSTALLTFAFGCTASTMLYCLFYGTFGIIPNKLDLTITQNTCQYTAQLMGNLGWQLSRYFFYMFMLWRIKSIRQPLSIILSQYIFIIYLILIHLWLILALCIIIFWTKRTVTPSGKCAPVIIEIVEGFTNSDIRTVLWVYDFILTFLLLFLFIWRLYKLKIENTKINKFKKKTFILSIFALITSITMPALRHFIDTREWRYFIPLDQITNLLCIVFSYSYKIDDFKGIICIKYIKNNDTINGENVQSMTDGDDIMTNDESDGNKETVTMIEMN